MIRTFVAVELSADLREALTRVQSQLRKGLQSKSSSDPRIQWVKPDGIHLTLKFLGEIAESLVEDIRTALTPAVSRFPRFRVEIQGLGGFPDLRAPRVLWVGVTGPGVRTQPDEGTEPGNPLVHLARTIDQVLEPLGFAPETKPFHPHLTLARIKERSREVGRVMADRGGAEPVGPLGTLGINGVALVKSDLKPSGAVYTRLWEVPLAGDDG